MIKFFQKFAIRTGYDVFSYFSLVIMIATYALPVILYPKSKPFAIFALIGLILANILRNQRLANFGRVVFVTFIQLVCGVIAPIILIVKIIMHATGKAKVINYEALCWAGERSTDDERAKGYGFRSVDDAINAGVLFDGTKIWE